MKIINIKNLDDLDVDLRGTVSVLKNDDLIIFPTETLYGIGANALSEKAVKKIFLAKKRLESKPILVLISKIEMLDRLVFEIPKIARGLMTKFWPGPLTIIFEKRSEVPSALNPGGNTIAVRMTSSPIAQKIINLCNFPITAPSANISGKEPIKNYKEALEEFGDSELIKCMIENENMKPSKPSTIVDVSGGDLRVIREGVISQTEIEKALR